MCLEAQFLSKVRTQNSDSLIRSLLIYTCKVALINLFSYFFVYLCTSSSHLFIHLSTSEFFLHFFFFSFCDSNFSFFHFFCFQQLVATIESECMIYSLGLSSADVKNVLCEEPSAVVRRDNLKLKKIK